MKYFLHDTNAFDDEKITELYMNFGYEGLGLFYTLLEKIAKQEKPIKTSVLKSQLNIGKRLNKCWNFMESLDIISSSNGETFNKQLLNFSEKYQIKKEKTRNKVSEWRENQADAKTVTGYVSIRNAPKVKESKVKESKVNKYSREREILKEVYNLFNPKYFDTESKKINWLEEIRKLLEMDNEIHSEIVNVIKFGRTDDFWKSNFLSISALRSKNKSGVSKYDSIKANMESQKPKRIKESDYD
jgi:hypothetical protein